MNRLVILAVPLALVGAYFSLRNVPATHERANVIDSQVELVELDISISPATILQGDPALVSISGLGTSTVKSLIFNTKGLSTFIYNSKPSALIGIDLKTRSGNYP